MMAPLVLLQSTFCALKKKMAEVGSFQFLVLDISSARILSAELQLESQSETMGPSGI
jgi:hypothetical protein